MIGSLSRVRAIVLGLVVVCLLLPGRGVRAETKPAQKHAPQAQLNKALIQAWERGQQERMETLLKRGADPNMRVNDSVRTLLMDAAGWGEAHDIRILVRFGAKVNARDSEGATALMYAVDHGLDDHVSLLLHLRADANLRNKKGETPLSIAEAALSRNSTSSFMHDITSHERRTIWRRIVRSLRWSLSTQHQNASQ